MTDFKSGGDAGRPPPAIVHLIPRILVPAAATFFAFQRWGKGKAK
jgi:hypothetical protein